MTRAVGLFAAALLAASLGVAPDTSTSGTASRQNHASILAPASNLSPTTTGCLLGSALGTGSFRLTENRTGVIDSLTGDAEDPEDCSAQLGDEVEVTPQLMSGTLTASGSREKGNSSPQRIASAISLGSDACESNTTLSSGASWGSLLGAAERSTSTGLFAGPGTNSSENAALAEPSPDDQASQMAGENVPQTSNLLPLLGLVGVGSLIAGFFMRR
jgi:hypothetical protein